MSEQSVKQLYERKGDEYIPFLPTIELKAILESVTERSIAYIFHHYNHFNAEWTNTAEDTRAQVPPQLRRNGLWLSYNKDLHTKVTERYIGSDLDAADQAKWVDSDYWELLDFELLQKAAEEVIKNIFLNIHEYPDLEELIAKLINKYIGSIDWESIINEILGDNISEILNQYFTSPDGQEALKDALEDLIGDLLDELLADYFEEIQNRLTELERVIANGMVRHEISIEQLEVGS